MVLSEQLWALCRDVSELVMDQIELYRDTKESIMRGRSAEAWEGMSQGARDRALTAELKAEKNLHPALYPPEDSPAILGHYKVLRACGGMCFLSSLLGMPETQGRIAELEVPLRYATRRVDPICTMDVQLLLSLEDELLLRRSLASSDVELLRSGPGGSTQGWTGVRNASCRLSLNSVLAVSCGCPPLAVAFVCMSQTLLCHGGLQRTHSELRQPGAFPQ